MYLLCKSNIVEASDRSNLDVPTKTEKQVDQCGTLANINPNSKSYFRAKNVFENGIPVWSCMIVCQIMFTT